MYEFSLPVEGVPNSLLYSGCLRHAFRLFLNKPEAFQGKNDSTLQINLRLTEDNGWKYCGWCS